MEAKPTMHDGGVSLPADIIFEVLARLPTKPLCRFRCVCKGWRALISDRAFAAAQRSRVADPHLVVVFSGDRSQPPEVRVMDMDGNVVSVFEIEIARSTPLPPHLATRPDLICADASASKWHGGIIIDPAAGEAFAAFGTSKPDPSAISFSTILGRAAPSSIFKVLRLQKRFQWDDHGNVSSYHLCEVATIMDSSGGGVAETLTWRRKPTPPFDITRLRREYKAVVNGVIYLIHNKLEIDGDVDIYDDVGPSLCIVAFDLESEEWKAEAINTPTMGHQKFGWISIITLAEFNGTLAFVHTNVCEKYYTYLNIWLLTDPNKSVWVKKYMIPMPKNHIVPAKPLGILVDGRILFWSIVRENEEIGQNNTSLHYREVVQFYDPSKKVFTDLVDMAKMSKYTLVYHTGSLLC